MCLCGCVFEGRREQKAVRVCVCTWVCVCLLSLSVLCGIARGQSGLRWRNCCRDRGRRGWWEWMKSARRVQCHSKQKAGSTKRGRVHHFFSAQIGSFQCILVWLSLHCYSPIAHFVSAGFRGCDISQCRLKLSHIHTKSETPSLHVSGSVSKYSIYAIYAIFVRNYFNIEAHWERRECGHVEEVLEKKTYSCSWYISSFINSLQTVQACVLLQSCDTLVAATYIQNTIWCCASQADNSNMWLLLNKPPIWKLAC